MQPHELNRRGVRLAAMACILLIGDGGERRNVLAAALRGHDVTLASDGLDGFRIASAMAPDAVAIVDSPACDAVAFTTSARHLAPLHSCMIVVVASRDRHAELMRLGADQVLAADAMPQEFHNAMDGRLHRRQQLLEVPGVDSHRRHAEAIVRSMADSRRLHGVIALCVDRLDALSAALGGQAALTLRSELRRRISPLVPAGGNVAMLDDGAVIAVESASHTTLELAEALLRHARLPLVVEGRELRLRVHAGIVEVGSAPLDAATMVRRAEVAARDARDLGLPHPQLWKDDLANRVLGDLELASAMRRAVEQAEFRLVFQPQVGMDRGEPFGVEALIRWNLPGGVSVPPKRFVTVAEESGLIDDIGSWSLREACRHAVRCDEHGLRLRISVNVSAGQLVKGPLVDVVRQSLAESGLPGDRLTLEIGESAISGNADDVRAVLESLRNLGVTICVDDFGAGLATVAHLRNLPIQEIKIDRSFVRSLPGGAEDRLAVETVLRLARQLGLRTIAVGVETAAQWSWLKEQGCDAAQGWLIGKPLEADQLLEAVGHLRRKHGKFAEAAAD